MVPDLGDILELLVWREEACWDVAYLGGLVMQYQLAVMTEKSGKAEVGICSLRRSVTSGLFVLGACRRLPSFSA